MRYHGKFGEYGGCFVPEILVPPLEELEEYFYRYIDDINFKHELDELLKNYAGRPTPLYECQNLIDRKYGRIFLKREDLLHGGAHKTNQVLAQALLTKKMGKKNIIAETGAGQHGVATAIVGALFGLNTRVYMGAKDVERQKLNVFRMQLLGAEVIAVLSGEQTLKDAVNEALKDWSHSFIDTHYIIGSVVGPHPFPTMVKEFQRVISKEAKAQILAKINQLPHAVIACVGGGSNSMGMFADFIDDKSVKLIGVEGGGKGLHTPYHAATLQGGRDGILHGAKTKLMQNEDGQVLESHSISAGLDYPGVGPEHAYLQSIDRAQYVAISDDEAMEAFLLLSQKEGIIPAFESAHALAYAVKMLKNSDKPLNVIVNISGRGDKDMEIASEILKDKVKPVKFLGVKK